MDEPNHIMANREWLAGTILEFLTGRALGECPEDGHQFVWRAATKDGVYWFQLDCGCIFMDFPLTSEEEK